MLGFSIYKEHYNQRYIEKLKKLDVKNVFISLHITEDLNDVHGLFEYLSFLKNQELNLIVDISPITFSIITKEQLKSYGISTVRLDYGFDINETVELYDEFKLILNASTITDEDIESLQNNGLDLSKITLMHNFYPKEETGLSIEYYHYLNLKLKKYGFKILSFIPGNKVLRGPIHQGLPTVEEHRNKNLLVSMYELCETCDEVFIGDIEITDESIDDLKYFINDIIPIRIIDKGLDPKFINTPLKIRKDSNHLNLRIEDSRFELKTENKILVKDASMRNKGTITQDNYKSQRYNGEIMITRVDLPAKENLNVVGHIHTDYIDLLNLSLNGKTIIFLES